MTYRRRTYPEVLDNLLTQLAGGVAGEAHPFPPQPDGSALRHSLERPPAVEVVSVYGSRDAQPRLFRRGKDYDLLPDQQTLTWLDGAEFPDAGTLVHVNYLRKGTRPLLTDLQAGSVVRTLAESISLEIARLYAQLEVVYQSGFIDTASGSSLDNVVAMLGIERVSGGRPVGELQFSRAAATRGSITIPAGTRVMTRSGDVEYETTATVTMAELQTSVRVAARDLEPNEPLPADALEVLVTTIAGVDSVTNPAPTAIASADESDVELRTRAKNFLHGSERATLGALRHAIARQQITADVEEQQDSPGYVVVTPHVESMAPELQQRLLTAIEDARPAGVFVSLKQSVPPRKVDLELRLETVSGLTEQDLRAAHRSVRSKVEDYFARLPVREAGSINQLVGLALSVPEVKDIRLARAALQDGRSVLDLAGGKLQVDGFPTVLGELQLADPNLPTTLAMVVTYPDGQAPPDKAQIEAALGQALSYLSTVAATELPDTAPQSEKDKRSVTFGKLLWATPIPNKPAKPLPDYDAAATKPALPTEAQIAPYGVRFAISQDSGLTRTLSKGSDSGYALAGKERLVLSGVTLQKGAAVPSYAAIRDRLPSLYRPQPDAAAEASLFVRLLQAVGSSLDDIDTWASEVLQSHWLDFADRALYSQYFRRRRVLAGEPQITLDDPRLDQFPFIADLARLGALLPALPWREPPGERELVEAYRDRIRRTVAIYANGLGTVRALGDMARAQLPRDLTRPEPLRGRACMLEEFAPIPLPAKQVQARGAPADRVGPLMRWLLGNDGVRPLVPTLYVQGVTPEPERVDPTIDPVIELFARDTQRLRLGIGYQGTLAPGQTLRLRPSHAAWLAGEAGLLRADSLPGDAPSGPTARGPWTAVNGAPAGMPTALHQSREQFFWVAVQGPNSTSLWKFDGTDWTEVLKELPVVYCLAQDGDTLLVGTDKGLLRLSLYPVGSATPEASPEPQQLDGTAVLSLVRAADGRWFAGTAAGAATLSTGDALTPFVLGADATSRTVVHAVHQDRMGTLYFGTAIGVFQHQPASGHWHWYSGRDSSDQLPDWLPLAPDKPPAQRNFPRAEQVFLPPVHSLLRARDACLWLGTEKGIARYRAFAVDGLAYTTLLEAFPDITTAPVRQIAEDELGALWFATAEGLFRFDGRDWWQSSGGALIRLGESRKAGQHWRFNRGTGRWESAERRAGVSVWTPFGGSVRGSLQPSVHAIAWTDGVVADLGSWDGGTFAPDAAAIPGPVSMRYKPDDTRLVDAGLPAVPRLPPGASEWRYLQREVTGEFNPNSTPAWSREGRLAPPPVDVSAWQEGRYGVETASELSAFDESVYAYNPAARVWFELAPHRPLSVLLRLATEGTETAIDPAVLDRVWQGLEQVRPAGVRALLAVNESIVRGR